MLFPILLKKMLEKHVGKPIHLKEAMTVLQIRRANRDTLGIISHISP